MIICSGGWKMGIGIRTLGSASSYCTICPARSRGVCGSLSRSDQAAVSEKSVRTLLGSGSAIQKQGEECRQAGVVVSGRAKMTYYPVSGDEQTLHILQPGDLIGTPRFSKNSVSVFAATDMVVCNATRDKLRPLFNESPIVYSAYLNVFSKQMESIQIWHAELRWRNTLERLAFWLSLQLPLDAGASDVIINIQLTRSDLASCLNMSVETLCRSLRQLKNSGAITMHSPSQIGVHDHSRLIGVANDSQFAPQSM